MFDYVAERKTLIIVCDEKTEQYANFLRQLISAKDDTEEKVVGTKDGTVDAGVYLEKEYSANKFDMSIEQYVLFIGNNKTSNSESSSMKTKFNEHGMKYGWLGKRGFLSVDDKTLSEDEYDDFFAFATNYQNELERIDSARRKDSSNKTEVDGDDSSKTEKFASGVINGVATTAVAVGTLVSHPVMRVAGIAAYGVGSGLDRTRAANKIKKQRKDQQYRVLILKFYADALSSFLEG